MKRILYVSFLCVAYFMQSQVPIAPSQRDINRVDVAEPPAPDAPKSMYNTVSIFKQQNRYGLKDDAKIIVEATLDSIIQLNTTFILFNKGKQGVHLISGKEFLPILYDSIVSKYTFLVAYRKKEMTLYSTQKYYTDLIPTLLTKQKRHKIVFSNPQFLVFEAKNEQYLATNQGHFIENNFEKIIIPYSGNPIIESKGTFAILPLLDDEKPIFYDEIKNEKKAILDTKNLRNAYKNIYYGFGSEKYIVQNQSKVGLIDSNGKVLIDVAYDKIENYDHKPYYYIISNQKTGLYHNGNILKPEFNSLQVEENYIYSLQNNKHSLYKLSNLQSLPIVSETKIQFGDPNQFIVSKNGKFGLVNELDSVLIPFVYDRIQEKSRWSNSFPKDQYKVSLGTENDEREGIYSVSKQKAIIPVEHKFISFDENGYYRAKKNNSHVYYDTLGAVLLNIGSESVEKSPFRKSKIEVHRTITNSKNPKTDELFLVDKKTATVLEKDIISYEMIYDSEMLYNPFGEYVSAIQHKNGKFALYDEKQQKRLSSFEYDAISQRFFVKNEQYIVKKNSKYGVVNQENSIIIPFEYDELTVCSFVSNSENSIYFVAKKNDWFGVINLENNIVIPFVYKHLERVSYRNLFKAKKKNAYQLISIENKVLNPEFFDDISQFEFHGDDAESSSYSYENTSNQPIHQAMTFQKGKMKMINSKGEFTGEEANFSVSKGYKTFDELKSALIHALDSESDVELKNFCLKLAPSSQTLYWLHKSFPEKYEFYDYEGRRQQIANTYFELLVEFKNHYWNSKYYNQNSLRRVQDYTLYSDGMVTVKRSTDWAYEDTRLMEKVLRNCMKVNGSWISSFFMRSNFDSFR